MISTVILDDSSSSISKVLEPGNHIVTINSIKLEAPPYNKDAYSIVLGLEGPDMGEGFEGFFINKEDESLGRHKGQVAFVKMSQYAYADGTTKTGIKIDRNMELVRALKNLCSATGCSDWLEAENNKHETIESLFEKFASDKPFAGSTIRCCIAGKEYQNNKGYTNFDLFFAKPGRGQYAYESATTPVAVSKVIEFNPDTHIIRKKVEAVTSFGDNSVTTSSSVGDDFQL
jgi:hypothetical protein